MTLRKLKQLLHLIQLPWLLLFNFLLVFTLPAIAETAVECPAGAVVGLSWSLGGGQMANAFLALPYALQPTRTHRFKEPKRMPRWSHVFNATAPSTSCAWYDFWTGTVKGNDECLRLDVYTPKIPTTPNDDLLPVLALLATPNRSFQPRPFTSLIAKHVVIVVIHYRIDLLGFLSTGDSVLPGNYGLLDALMALQWVQTNIAYFGGDSNKVTLMGENDGATHAFYLHQSPRSKGLFSQVILESGTALTETALSTTPSLDAVQLAVDVTCTEARDSKQLALCLEFKSVESMLQAEHALQQQQNLGGLTNRMKPVIDVTGRSVPVVFRNYSLPTDRKLPIMIGVSANAGFRHVTEYMLSLNGLFPEQANNLNIIPGLFRNLVGAMELTKAIETFYKDRKCPIDKAIQAVTDALYYRSANKIASIYSRTTNVFLYEFTYKPRSSMFHPANRNPINPCAIESMLDDVTLTEHFEDLVNSLVDGYSPNLNDRVVTDVVTTLLSNFISTGQPTVSSDQLPSWKPTTPSDPSYYTIDLEPTLTNGYLKKEETAFWSVIQDLVPSFRTITASAAKVTQQHKQSSEECVTANGYVVTTWVFFGLIIFMAIASIYLSYSDIRSQQLCDRMWQKCFPHLYGERYETEI